jgi:hypothetical protein
MTDYTPVQKALSDGVQPSVLCATCPWDRMCISPPTTTRAEIDARMAMAAEQDDRKLAEARAAGSDPGLPVGSLLTALTFGGRDTMATVCPVYALRLRSSSGRAIADTTRAAMQAWDDEQ